MPISRILTFLVVLFCSRTVFSLPDSSRFSGEEQTIYLIQLERLKRLIKNELGENQPKIAELAGLVKDARDFYENGETGLAIEFLETALLMLDSAENNLPSDDNALSPGQWTFLAISGAELWQQRFGLVYGQTDSVIFESEGNPFIGVRANYDYQKGHRRSTQLELEAKFSTDYHSALVTLNHNQQIGTLRTFANNYFDFSLYKKDKELSSLENRLDLGVIFEKNHFGLVIRDELQIRLYQHQSDYFFSYAQNRFEPKLYAAIPAIGRVELVTSTRERKHTSASQRNYRENWSGVNFWTLPQNRLNFVTQFYQKRRTYSLSFVDSLLNNNFDEWYVSTETFIQLNHRLKLRVNGRIEKRAYQTMSTATPDYTEYVVEPSFEVHPGFPFLLRLGFRYQLRDHSFGQETDLNADIENFFSYGPVLGLDIVAANGFVASISNSYSYRRYPNSPYTDGPGFSLYSNRNINALFFFVSWNMALRWDLNLIAHFDFDNDQAFKGSDSRTNLINFELSYKF